MRDWRYERDPDLLGEAALATSQALMGNALAQRRRTDAAVAAQMGVEIDELLSGANDNLSVKTLGRFLAICGFRLKMEIVRIPDGAEGAAPGGGT